jgi:nucleotide-binding universal stress UspA family protein
VTYGFTLAGQFNARVIIAHIVPESSALMYAFPTETFAIERDQEQKARREIASLVPTEYASQFDVQTIVKTGSIEPELLGIVKDQRVDLVVMGTHGRRYLGRWFLGSVTERMLRKIPVPLLTVSHVDTVEHTIGLVMRTTFTTTS